MAPERRWLEPVRYAVWFGFVSGVLETVVRLLRQRIGGVPLHLGMYVLWMPECINVILFALLGFGLAVLVRLRPGLLPNRILIPLLASLSLFIGLWAMSPPFHLGAIALIAGGGGLQWGRVLNRREGGFRRVTQWTVPAFLVAIVVVGVGIEGSRRWHEVRTLGSLPETSGRRPNVLLLVLDTVRAMNLSAYGYFRPTSPHLAQLGARGVRFDHAFSTAPWTLPSHASMFTGRWLHEQNTGWKEPLNGTWPTLAETMNREGYATAGFIANYAYCDREYGLDRGFAHYEDYPLTWQQVLMSSRLGKWVARLPNMYHFIGVSNDLTRTTAEDLRHHFLDWSADHEDRPWFAFINFVDAHWTYWWDPSLDSLYRGDSLTAPPRPIKVREVPPSMGDMTPQPIADYDRAITYIDREIGALLSELERRGELENTLVIVTADHGEEFWEHGMIGHGNALYQETLAVPLFMALPGKVPAGQVIRQPVSLRNLPATIMYLSGSPTTAPFPGAPMARFWDPAAGSSTTSDTVLTEVNYVWDRPAWYPASKGSMRAFFSDTLHLIRNGDGRPELYNWAVDRWEQSPLPEVVLQDTLVDRLVDRLEEVPDPPTGRRAHRKLKYPGKTKPPAQQATVPAVDPEPPM